MSASFDQAALVAALEKAREQRGISWRQVAAEADLEPSTLQRIVGGSTPDLARFVALVDWLELPSEDFIRRSNGQAIHVRLPGSQLLVVPARGRPQLTDGQVVLLGKVIGLIHDIVDLED